MLNVARAARGFALPVSVLLVGWTLGGALYVWMDRDRVHDDELHRESIIAGVESDLRIRLAMYENALRAAAGDLAVSDHLKSPADWHIFVSRLGLLTRYPGVEATSIIQPVPHAQLQDFIAGRRRNGSPDFDVRTMFGAPPPALPPSEHFLIVCAEPPAVAARALGDDMATDPVRRAAAERARDSGEPAFSRNAQLGRGAGLGLQVFFPVYRNGLPLATVEQRRAALSAWVTAVFVADTFFRSAMHGQQKFVDLQVFDSQDFGHAAAPASRLFSSNLAPPEGRPFGRTTALDLDGVAWILGWNRTPWFPFASKAASASAAGFSALVTLLVAALIFRLQSVARRTQTKLDLEQQRAEETRAFLASLVQSSDDSIVGTTLDGSIVSWNRGSERLWGYTAGEAIGQPITMLFLPERKPDFRTGIERVQRDEPIERYESVRVRKDGTHITVSVILSPIKDARGRLLGVSAIYSDITQRKLAEQELLRAKEAAEAASRAKSQFLANMSHEIRTPMNGILGMTEAVLDTQLDPEQRDYLTTAKTSGEALLTVINDILDFSKIEAGMLHLENIEFQVRECVEDTVKVLALSARQKGLDLICERRSSVPRMVCADALRIRQVLMNLIGNAVKFTARGQVVVSVEAVNTGASACELHFAVRDTGIGISLEKQQAIFAPFAQADGSITRQYGGTGLGLTISKRLAEMMGGRIWFESEPYRGSTFFFTIPAAVVESPAAVSPA
jgi:PAS domain S-box-containing protein